MAAKKNLSKNIFDNCCHSVSGNVCFPNWLSCRCQLLDVYKSIYLLRNLLLSLQFIFSCNINLQVLSQPSSCLHFLVHEIRSSLLTEIANQKVDARHQSISDMVLRIQLCGLVRGTYCSFWQLLKVTRKWMQYLILPVKLI